METLIESFDRVTIENFPSLLATSPEILPWEYKIMLAPAKGSADLESTICPDHWERTNKNRQEKKLMETSRFIQSKTMNEDNGYNISRKDAKI
jgi:hypothetical protein